MINHVYDIPDKLLIKNGKSPKQIRRSKHGKSISNFTFWMFLCHDLITGHYDKKHEDDYVEEDCWSLLMYV